MNLRARPSSSFGVGVEESSSNLGVSETVRTRIVVTLQSPDCSGSALVCALPGSIAQLFVGSSRIAVLPSHVSASLYLLEHCEACVLVARYLRFVPPLLSLSV